MCALLRYNDDDVLDLLYTYDVHCNMPRGLIKSNVKRNFMDSLHAGEIKDFFKLKFVLLFEFYFFSSSCCIIELRIKDLFDYLQFV
jgi:hypothetical protein